MINICQFFPESLRQPWMEIQNIWNSVVQIRIRVNRPVIIELQDEEIILKDKNQREVVYMETDLESIFRHMCHDSVYAYEQERMQGFITVEGGHRVGITGEIIKNDKGYIAKYIRYMNIRIAREIKGIASKIIRQLYNNKQPYNTLIVSPPGVGKTTLLRDIVRHYSNGGITVGLVDERGEIAASYRGMATFDCGLRTDVVTGGDKEQDISILVRTFAPKLVAMDEIGAFKDSELINYAKVSGCQVLATAHGINQEDLINNPNLRILIKNKVFDRFVYLQRNQSSGTQRIAVVSDSGGNVLDTIYLSG